MWTNLKAFPYPVLGRGDDYTDSEFQALIDTKKLRISDNEERVTIDYSFMMSNSEIRELISSGEAKYAIEITCTDTLYRHVLDCTEIGNHTFEAGQLYGKVIFSPLVVATKIIKKYSPIDLNYEFGGFDFKLMPGDLLAFDEPQIRYIEFNKLKFESLVRVQTSAEIPEETYRFQLDGDLIIIMMGKKFRVLWDSCREQKDKAPFLAMSVYKDCIHAALDYSIKDENSEELKWARALRLKLQSLGRKIHQDSDFNDLSVHAQQLVSRVGVQRLLKDV